MKTTLMLCLLLCGCGEIIPCKTDELGTREIHSGTLRTDGIYISDRGGLSCSGDCGSINFIYPNGLYYEGGAIEDANKSGLTPNTFEYSLSGNERSELVFSGNVVLNLLSTVGPLLPVLAIRWLPKKALF